MNTGKKRKGDQSEASKGKKPKLLQQMFQLASRKTAENTMDRRRESMQLLTSIWGDISS